MPKNKTLERINNHSDYLPGDINKDNQINIFDLLGLLAYLQAAPTTDPAAGRGRPEQPTDLTPAREGERRRHHQVRGRWQRDFPADVECHGVTLPPRAAWCPAY